MFHTKKLLEYFSHAHTGSTKLHYLSFSKFRDCQAHRKAPALHRTCLSWAPCFS